MPVIQGGSRSAASSPAPLAPAAACVHSPLTAAPSPPTTTASPCLPPPLDLAAPAHLLRRKSAVQLGGSGGLSASSTTPPGSPGLPYSVWALDSGSATPSASSTILAQAHLVQVSPRVSPVSSPIGSPRLRASPLPSPLCAAIDGPLLGDALVPLPPRSPSIPIPIASSPVSFRDEPEEEEDEEAGLTRSGRGIPFAAAAPMLASPENRDPFRYTRLHDDRVRAAAAAAATVVVPPPMPPSPPPRFADSSSPPKLEVVTRGIESPQQQQRAAPLRLGSLVGCAPSPASPPRRRPSLLRIGRVIRAASSSSLSPSSSDEDLGESTAAPLDGPLVPNPEPGLARTPSGRRASGVASASPSKFVGSYEESLLSGRLSVRPSNPIVFSATLGVMGLGKCKSALRCPPHVSVDFSAHYYDLAANNAEPVAGTGSPSSPPTGVLNSPPTSTTAAPWWRASPMASAVSPRPATGWWAATATDSPIASPSSSPQPAATRTLPVSGSPTGASPAWSPYVGVIDLDTLPTSPSAATRGSDRDLASSSTSREGVPGGYRVPARGQLQVVIKNPHRTALKVFLVPYDLSGMPRGTKTVLRHKQYAVPVASAAGSGGKDPDMLPAASSPKQHVPAKSLRYALQIPVVCTPRGRIYLAGAGGLRVVFSGKGPESHETLVATTDAAVGFTPWEPPNGWVAPPVVEGDEEKRDKKKKSKGHKARKNVVGDAPPAGHVDDEVRPDVAVAPVNQILDAVVEAADVVSVAPCKPAVAGGGLTAPAPPPSSLLR
ncbi:hypothetical protein H9P43_007886 [Blastocladiella emersonii ATCC 22665]|nr:hypothetical protein H9P43_007886 [Blastocladiella emersonii ATCC 22665]